MNSECPNSSCELLSKSVGCHVTLFFHTDLSCDPTRTADVAAVIMHEGEAPPTTQPLPSPNMSYVQVLPTSVW